MIERMVRVTRMYYLLAPNPSLHQLLQMFRQPTMLPVKVPRLKVCRL